MELSNGPKPTLRLPNVKFFELHMDGAKGLVRERNLWTSFATSAWEAGNPIPVDGIVDTLMASDKTGIGIGEPTSGAKHLSLRADDRPRIPADALRALDQLDDAARRAGVIDVTVVHDRVAGTTEYGFRRAPWHDHETTSAPSAELLEFVATATSIIDTLHPSMQSRP